jgi:hypothetical protein
VAPVKSRRMSNRDAQEGLRIPLDHDLSFREILWPTNIQPEAVLHVTKYLLTRLLHGLHQRWHVQVLAWHNEGYCSPRVEQGLHW